MKPLSQVRAQALGAMPPFVCLRFFSKFSLYIYVISRTKYIVSLVVPDISEQFRFFKHKHLDIKVIVCIEYSNFNVYTGMEIRKGP